MIFAPHPDDEINLAGGLFEEFNRYNIETTVVICTTGDYVPSLAHRRYEEVLKVKKIFKYNNLEFLGYGDNYKGTHLYEIGQGIATSHSGRRATYSAGAIDEYCFKYHGVHRSYMRINLFNDIQDIIQRYKPDLMICVDVDSHSDHRCLSLVFDEAIGDLLKKGTGYYPIILKEFAYMGVWNGSFDFFCRKAVPMSPCINESLDIRFCFPYDWNNRIQIKNSENTQSFKLWKNPIFKALLAEKTQSVSSNENDCAIAKFPRIANPDSCFWLRDTRNLALKATITASSGNVKYLNDFLVLNPTHIRGDNLLKTNQGWTPNINDRDRIIEIKFETPLSVALIKVYQNFNCRIKKIKVSTDCYQNEFPCSDSNVISLQISSAQTKTIKIQIVEYGGEQLIINEIECLESDSNENWLFAPLSKYDNCSVTHSRILSYSFMLLYKCFVQILLVRNRIINKIKCIMSV